jgi:hypothetical protein
MRRRSLLIIIAVIFFPFRTIYAVDNGLPRIEIKNNSAILVLPNSLKQYISQQYPELRVPTPADMRGLWANFKKTNGVPYACWGHFDDKNRTDIALILLGKEEWRVLAFHPLENDQYAVLPLEDYVWTTKEFTSAHPPQDFYLFCLKTGKNLVLDGEFISKAKHPHDSAAFVSLKDPKTGILYQWMPPTASDQSEYRYGVYVAHVFGALSD